MRRGEIAWVSQMCAVVDKDGYEAITAFTFHFFTFFTNTSQEY